MGKMYQIEIANPQNGLHVDESFLREVAERTLVEEQVQSAAISIALVDNSTIHELNRRYLNHDFPTDVLSFPLQSEATRPAESSGAAEAPEHLPSGPSRGTNVGQVSNLPGQLNDLPKDPSNQIPCRARNRIDGEIIISAEMAKQSAAEFCWNPGDELVFYLVHGLLHLCGYDDRSDSERRIMRSREREILELCGVTIPAGSAIEDARLQTSNRVSGAQS